MNEFLKLLTVFGSGMIGLWEGIPVGFVLQLPPLVTGAVSALGSTVATLLVVMLGEQVRARLVRAPTAPTAPTEGSPARPERLIDRVWRRYGIIGFGLMAPCLTGAPIGVAIGLFLRAPTGRLLLWLVAGIVLWSILLTTAGAYGSEGIRRLVTR